MIRNLALVGFGFGFLLLAQNGPKEILQVSNTQRLDFNPGDMLRLMNSIGNVRVQGWDRPQAEITTLKSTKKEYEPQSREKGLQELEKVKITAERHSEEVAIKTEFPRYGHFAPLMRGGTRFNLEYEIKVPYRARLHVENDIGGVYVENVTGDMHVTIGKGQITLLLPPGGQYAIDAKVRYGDVRSELPGQEHRTFFPPPLGHEFANPGWQRVHNSRRLIEWLVGRKPVSAAPPGATKLFLRVGSGDVVIIENRRLPLSSSAPK